MCSGFPIPNDPIYNGTVWGPNRGKGGDFGKSEDQVTFFCTSFKTCYVKFLSLLLICA